ncbi:hypothetical protein OCGS_2139 [Oceaniovalibus guishaninsula JLT2003]|uniref:Uncharacterized protein n=1 Tax=Oceaniovalibus guishaninsula JLT2003 TaxID=1231392 RepID=K2I4J0_9RHOB|nr:phosphotransferase [Oceaniovalibus guishaninsula]EKE43805.1 hypothetical protein OCGS_2139 [Oceaniovalibus guishaninsula JLT2003]
MSKTSIPERLSAGWLSGALKRPVAGFQAAPLGAGFTASRVWRLAVRLSDGGRRALVLKLSPEPAAARRLFADANRAELDAYAQGRAGAFAPALIHAEAGADGGTALLLDDPPGHRGASFADGCDAEAAMAVADLLARLHVAGRDRVHPPRAIIGGRDFADLWRLYPAALQRLLPGTRLSPALHALGDAMAAGDPALPGRLTGLHGDVQADNLLFGPNGAPLLIDWQMAGRGRGVADLAYFLAGSVRPDIRRGIEAAAIRHYCAVTGDAVADLRAAWPMAAGAKLRLSVAMTVLADHPLLRHRDWRRVDLERLEAFAADHPCPAPARPGNSGAWT